MPCYFCQIINHIMRLLALLLFCVPFLAHAQVITTVPITDSAHTAPFQTPLGVAKDHLGNLIVPDFNSNTVKKVTPSGLATIIAGNGTIGFSGDGGPATAARFNGPTSVAIDSVGNIYVVDVFNSVIRKIDTNHIITTAAGNHHHPGYHGDGGPADSAWLLFPMAIVFDRSGNLFVADASNNVVRKISTAGIITTFAGNGFGAGGAGAYSGDGGPADSARLYNPSGLAFDTAGNLFIDDAGNNVIRKVNTSGIISTFAGINSVGYSGDGGPATAAKLSNPELGLGFDAAGNMYIADVGNSVMRMIDPSGTISTLAGNGAQGYSGDGGPARFAQLAGPSGLIIDKAANVLFADAGNNVLRRISGISGIINVCLGDTSLFQARMPGGAWFTSDASVAPMVSPGHVKGLAAGSATIYYVVSGDTAIAPVSVTATPTAGAISGADSICLFVSNDTLTESMTGGYWSTSNARITLNGSNVIMPASGGIDTIYYNVPYTCRVAESSFPVTVVDASPGSLSGPDSICLGDTVTFSSTGVPGGQWELNDSVHASIVSPGHVVALATGEDFVGYVVNGNLPGCVLGEWHTIEIVKCATEVPALSIPDQDITLYPNPATESLHIHLAGIISEVVLIDYLGREIVKDSFTGSDVTLNIRALPQGIYLARINRTLYRKFVKE